MAQHDYSIANQSFPNTRQDLNNSLSAIVSNNSGATEPTTTYAYQWWYDETTDILKMRNADNDAWITMFTFNQTTDTYSLATDVELTLTENLDLTGSATISSDLTVNTDALKVDSTNKFVGIGTASPSAELDIQADVPSIQLTDTDGTNQIGLIYENAGNLFLQSQNDTANGKITLRRFDGSTLDTTITMDSGGGLLLGTTSAGSAVKGDIVVDGNIYLGGTGSANALDDYETGTWTPSAEFSGTNPTAGASTGTGSYTKVGDMVTLWGTVVNINVTGATGDLQITGLPFTSTLNTNLVEYAGCIRLGAVDFDTGYCTVSIPDGLSYIRVAENIDNVTTDFLAASNCNDGSSDFFFSVTYKTDS